MALRWSLNAARTDLLYRVRGHLPITGLHASANQYVGKPVRLETHTRFHSRPIFSFELVRGPTRWASLVVVFHTDA